MTRRCMLILCLAMFTSQSSTAVAGNPASDLSTACHQHLRNVTAHQSCQSLRWRRSSANVDTLKVAGAGIFQDAFVSCREWHTDRPSRGDKHAVNRVTLKYSG